MDARSYQQERPGTKTSAPGPKANIHQSYPASHPAHTLDPSRSSRGRSFGACFQHDASWACLAGGERNNGERELRLPSTVVPSARLERFGAEFSVGWTVNANVCTVDVRVMSETCFQHDVFAPVRLRHSGVHSFGHQFAMA
jgi:hypothetical protein